MRVYIGSLASLATINYQTHSGGANFNIYYTRYSLFFVQIIKMGKGDIFKKPSSNYPFFRIKILIYN